MTPHGIKADVYDPQQGQTAFYSVFMEIDSVELGSYAVGDITSTRVAALDFESCKWILDANLKGVFLCTYRVYLSSPNMHLCFMLGSL